MDSLPTTQTLKDREIRVLHIEPTDVCQAECPLCSREQNVHFDKSVKNQLDMEAILKHFDADKITRLDKMFACGNYGDPAAGSNTMSIFQAFRDINPAITLGMNTNGALQNKSWWADLGRLFSLQKDYVVFSIDGLADTNHIYRKNVVWDKIIENASSFISHGGSAHWDMLVYKHNEHQIEDCKQLAKDLGFKWFRAKVSRRPFIQGLEPPSTFVPIINQQQGKISCQALKDLSAYIDAKGNLHPCCWLGNSLFEVLDIDTVGKSWTASPHPTCKRTCSTLGSGTAFTNQWKIEEQLC